MKLREFREEGFSRRRDFYSFRKEIAKEIRRSHKISPITRAIGEKRERRVMEALTLLKEAGDIIDFIQTEELSFDNLARDTDFYVTAIVAGQHRFVPLSCESEAPMFQNRRAHRDRVRVHVRGRSPQELADYIYGKILAAESKLGIGA